MRLRLIFNYKYPPFSAGELAGSRLLGVEMIEARLSGNDFSIFGDLQSFTERFVCFHSFHLFFSMVAVKPLGPLLYVSDIL